MHPLYQKAAGLTETIIAAAIEVHSNKGPGLIESIYEWCVLKELGLSSLACVSQKVGVIEFKVSRGRRRCGSMCWLRDACSWKLRRSKDFANPQSAAFELHETA